MRREVVPIAVLALVLGMSQASAAEDAGAAADRLEAAGFAGARALPGIEVARVTGQDGARYHVVSGLDRMGGIDEMMDRGEVAPPARVIPVAADAADRVGTVEALDEAAEIGLELDVLLPEAGFEDYVLLERAHVAEKVAADGSLMHILFGLAAEEGD
jgi:hypothetical protein